MIRGRSGGNRYLKGGGEDWLTRDGDCHVVPMKSGLLAITLCAPEILFQLTGAKPDNGGSTVGAGVRTGTALQLAH